MDNPSIATGRVASNVAALGMGAAVSRALNFAAAIVLATRLGVAGYGALVYATTTVSYFQLLADFGLSVYATRELARDRGSARRWAAITLAARLPFTIASLILLALYLTVFPQPPLIFWLIVALSVGFPMLALSLDWAFQGVEAMDVVSLARIGQAATAAILAVLVISGPDDVLIAALLPAAGSAVLAVSLLAFFVRRYGLPAARIGAADLVRTMRATLPLGLSFILIQVYYAFDRLLLWHFRSPAEVGWYDAAYRIVLVFTGVAGVIAQAVLPSLSALAGNSDLLRARDAIGLLAKIMIYLGMPVAFGGALLAEPIIALIYGPAYAPAVGPLRLLIWQVFTVTANIAFAQALLAFDHQRWYFTSVLAGAALNLLCNLVLIPAYGMLGAGASTLVAEVAVLSLLIAFVFRKIVVVPIALPLAKGLAACALMSIAIVFISPLWAQLIGGALAYGVALLALSPFSADERRRLLARRLA